MGGWTGCQVKFSGKSWTLVDSKLVSIQRYLSQTNLSRNLKSLITKEERARLLFKVK